jgi:hypothetical protein
MDVTRGSLVVREAARAGTRRTDRGNARGGASEAAPAESEGEAASTGGIEIVATPRIGITQSADLPLRFIIAGNGFVSARRYNGPFSK